MLSSCWIFVCDIRLYITLALSTNGFQKVQPTIFFWIMNHSLPTLTNKVEWLLVRFPRPNLKVLPWMKHFILRWMIMRSGSIVLPPLFYVIAAEKDRLKKFWGLNNSIHPLVVWYTVHFSVEYCIKTIPYFHIGPHLNFRFYWRKNFCTRSGICYFIHCTIG